MNRSRYLQTLLLAFFVVGVIVPYTFLGFYIAEHGFQFDTIVDEIWSSRLSMFAWSDVIVSALALIGYVIVARIVTPKKTMLVVVLTLLVGVSAGLPLLLYFVVRGQDQHI